MQVVQPAPRQALRWVLVTIILSFMIMVTLWGVKGSGFSQAVKAKVVSVMATNSTIAFKAKDRVIPKISDLPIEALEWAKKELSRNETSRDIAGEAGKLRLWSQLQGRLDGVSRNLSLSLENQIMGWVGRGGHWSGIQEMKESWLPGRAVVITTGNRYAPMTLNLVRSIREVFNSTIPIQIYFAGQDDLKPEYRKVFMDYGATAVEDLKPLFSSELSLAGWDVKPFAMLACPWKEVLLLDADTVLVQSPEAFYADSGYEATGALFFTDRILGGGHEEKRRWIERILPLPLSETARASLFYLKRTVYWQESGAVLIDKGRCLAGMLGSCIINALPERDELHAHTHGEKEGYWLGFEMADQPYSMISTPAGSIGAEMETYRDHTGREQKKVCGKLAHFDRQGRLLWFNDGVVHDKFKPAHEQLPATLRWTLMSWDWTGLCAKWDKESLKTPDHFQEVFGGPWRLSPEETAIIERTIDLFLVDPLDPRTSLRTHAKRSTLKAIFYRLVAAIHL